MLLLTLQKLHLHGGHICKPLRGEVRPFSTNVIATNPLRTTVKVVMKRFMARLVTQQSIPRRLTSSPICGAVSCPCPCCTARRLSLPKRSSVCHQQPPSAMIDPVRWKPPPRFEQSGGRSMNTVLFTHAGDHGRDSVGDAERRVCALCNHFNG